MGVMVLGIDEKFIYSGKKIALPLIIFIKKVGVTPNHQIFGSCRPVDFYGYTKVYPFFSRK